MARTGDQELAAMGISIEARDVMDNEELAEYCRQGGKPTDVGLTGSDDGGEPPWL